MEGVNGVWFTEKVGVNGVALIKSGENGADCLLKMASGLNSADDACNKGGSLAMICSVLIVVSAETMNSLALVTYCKKLACIFCIELSFSVLL